MAMERGNSRVGPIVVAMMTLFGAACGLQAVPTPIGSSPLTGGWIDGTAPLDPTTTPVYEGDAPISFQFLKDMRKGDALTLSAYSLGAHSGTHIDAPMHFIRDGASIDRVPLEPLIGAAVVIDIPDNVQAIDAAELRRD